MLAKLNKKEDAFWVKVFSEEVNNGRSESEADSRAWVVTKKTFPRLKKFDGCKP